MRDMKTGHPPEIQEFIASQDRRRYPYAFLDGFRPWPPRRNPGSGSSFGVDPAIFVLSTGVLAVLIVLVGGGKFVALATIAVLFVVLVAMVGCTGWIRRRRRDEARHRT